MKAPPLLLSSLALLAMSQLVSPIADAYYPIEGYECNWKDPRIDTLVTASRNALTARLRVSDNIFAGGPADNVNGKLEFFLNTRKIQEETFAKMREIRGPYIHVNDRKRAETVVSLSVPPPEPSRDLAYLFSSKDQKFRKSYIEDCDYLSTSAKLHYVRSFSFGGTNAELSWSRSGQLDAEGTTLRVQEGKSKLTLALQAEELKAADDHNPSYSGPYVLSLNNDGKKQIILRLETFTRDEISSYRVTYDRVYFKDEKTKKWKFASHYWSASYPRFADLKKNGKTQWISENYELSRESLALPGSEIDYSEGPLQIWEWSKDNKFIDATRLYPDEIRKHAQVCLARYKANSSRESTALCYVGDLCLLGEKKKALAVLAAMETEKSKKLHGRIVKQLQKHGYL